MKILRSMQVSLREPHFREPLYSQWRLVEDDLLAELHGELRQTLASVLNAPDVAAPEAAAEAVAVVSEGQENGEQDVAAILAFFKTIPHAFRDGSSAGSDEGVAGEPEGEQLPAEFCQQSFRVAAVCTDDASLSLFHQQRLAHFLDIAEGRLVRETALRSRAFFAALAQLRSLYGRVAETVDTIQLARHCLEGVESTMSHPGVALAMLVRRLENLKKVRATILELNSRIASDSSVDRLIERGLLLEALELQEESECVSVFQCRQNGAAERMARIEKCSEEALVNFVLGKEIVSGGEPESVLASLCNVLMRMNRLEAAWGELRSKCVVSAEKLEGDRLLGVGGTLSQCTALLQRLSLTMEMIGKLTGDHEEEDEREDETGTVQAVTEAMDARCAKLLRARGDEYARMRLEDFAAVFDECAQFEKTLVSGKHFKLCLNSIGRQFVDQLHRHQCMNLSAVLESERWVSLSVPREFQAVVNGVTGKDEGLGEGSERALDEIVVGGVRHKTVAAALLCIQALSQYVACAKRLPLFEHEIMLHLAKLLMLFNSKAALLILGAEAINATSGIKAISAKHLALCSESVGAIRSLLPFLRTSSAEQVALWETVGREFDDHQRDLLAKLVAIMHGLASSQIGPGGSIAVLVEKTQSLFRILEKVLKREKVEQLFDSIWNVYTQLLNPALPEYDRLQQLRATCLKEHAITPPPPPVQTAVENGQEAKPSE